MHLIIVFSAVIKTTSCKVVIVIAMGNKSRRKGKKLCKNRGGERLQEWRILKSFNQLPQSTDGIREEIENPDLIQIVTDDTTEMPLQELVIEPGETPADDSLHERENVEGRRVVDIAYFFEQVKLLNNHAPQFGCTFNNLTLKKEIVRGLRSGFVFLCDMCGFTDTVWSDPDSECRMDINAAAVAGSISTGGGFANLTKMLGAMNIRCMGSNTFDKYNNIISKGWEESALAEMKLAADEEAALARERNDIDRDGVPLLTVVADGSWSKRSYRTNFNSLSGVVST